MSFFILSNLTHQAVQPGNPWEFVFGALPSDEIRSNKEKRQQFHRNPSTVWSYYSAVEGANPNQRPSKQNPARLIHAFAAEYDLPLSLERVNEAIEKWRIKPAYVERSLGGNLRLVFLFSRPLPVDGTEFAVFVLQKAVIWLALGLLPGLDEAAFTDPNRFLANGTAWHATGHGPVPEEALQAFFVEAGKEFRFTPPDSMEIPLDTVHKALVEKYPNFSWPGDFTLESAGPSFWVPNSLSTRSAILKADGFFSFSGHADKPFFSWSDLLGADFVKKISDSAISKATAEIWYDGRRFWRKKHDIYVGMELVELNNYLKTDCGLSAKGKQLDFALSHIFNHQYVESAGPYLFRKPGLLTYQGRRRLNTTSSVVMPPAAGTQTWGPTGSFPFVSSLLDNIFTSDVQRDHFLAWYQYFFLTGLNQQPLPGQAVFFMGGVNTGKTFTSREIIGRSVGGYVDASSYLIKGESFNSHVFECALWCLDDDTISDSPQAAQNLQNMLKKAVANHSFLSNKKFMVAGMLEWNGRIVATTNTDYLSSRMLGPLDNSSFDKISVFRCQPFSKIKFPPRIEIEKILGTEMPGFLRWLVDHTPPDHVERDNRFGYKSWHESTLMDQASQTSKAAPFKEILIDALTEFFKEHPDATEWRGTSTQLTQLFHLNPMRECVIRTLRLEQTPRYLENVDKDGALKSRVETGALNTRLWVFPRF